jgi:hypothetical protein
MADPTPRAVRLIDARDPARPVVSALLRRGFPADRVDEVEDAWARARQEAAGQVPVEHAHWNWRHKVDNVYLGNSTLMAVECGGAVQGLMAVFTAPHPSRLGGGRVVYVDYLEVAPWNLKGLAHPPRFLGVGTALIADAVRLGVETGMGGAVGLHSLPQAEPFYARIGMTRVGLDPDYYDLTYFEYDAQTATNWLAAEEAV